MALGFDDFARAALESRALGLDVPPAAIVHQASLYYLAQRGSARVAFRIPRFAREPAGPGEPLRLDLELDEPDWAALEVEAKQQTVSVERLVEHATLLFLADIDSGRVTVRILEGEEEADEDEDLR